MNELHVVRSHCAVFRVFSMLMLILGNVKSLTTHRDQLHSECVLLREQIDVLTARFEFTCTEHTRLESELENVTRERSELKSLHDTLHERFESLTSRFEFLCESHTEMEGDLEKVDGERSRFLSERNMLQEQFDTLAHRHDYLIETQNALETEFDEVSSERSRLQRETDVMKERFEIMSARFAYLCDASTSLENELCVSKEDVKRQRAKSAKFKGILCFGAALLRVLDQYRSRVFTGSYRMLRDKCFQYRFEVFASKHLKNVCHKDIHG